MPEVDERDNGDDRDESGDKDESDGSDGSDGMTAKVCDGHVYWKLRITSIHTGERGSIWIVGDWFYSPSDLLELNLSKR